MLLRGPAKFDERRNTYRYPCCGEALVKASAGTLLVSPLPSGTEIDVLLVVQKRHIRAKGRVCASRIGFGMGPAFTEISRRNYISLTDLAWCVSEASPRGSEQPTTRSPNREAWIGSQNNHNIRASKQRLP